MSITPSNYLQIEERPIDALKPFPHNARIHSKKQIHQIAASIRGFGFTNPVLIDQSDVIIAGHGRWEAARLLGLMQVPTIRIEHLTEAQKRAYVIADNKLALNAGWDPEILAIEFQHLAALDLDFDLELIGFETAEIDLIIETSSRKSEDVADQIPRSNSPPVTREGDVWILGNHKIVCGDARDASVYSCILQNEKARVVFADPPPTMSRSMDTREVLARSSIVNSRWLPVK